MPDRAAAAAWYSDHLGFEPVGEYAFWAEVVRVELIDVDGISPVRYWAAELFERSLDQG